MKKFLKIFGISMAVLLVLFCALVGALVFYVQSADHKALFKNLVQANTKMNVEVSSIFISLFPIVKLNVSDLKVLPFTGEKNIVEVAEIAIHAKPSNLIMGRLDGVRVVQPKVNLYRDDAGKANWESPRKSRHSSGAAPNPLMIFAMGELFVEGADFSYISEPEKKKTVIENMNIELATETERKRKMTFTATMNGVPLDLTARLNIGGMLVPIEATAKAANNSLQARGTVDVREGSFNGSLSLDAKTLVATLVKLRLLTPGVVQETPVIFSTQAQLNNKKMSFTDTQMAAGPYSISGNSTFAKTKKGWHVDGQLVSNTLNLDLIGKCGGTQPAGQKKPAVAPWSTTAIDATPLQNYTFNLDITANDLTCAGNKITQARLVVQNDGVTVRVDEARADLAPNQFVTMKGRLHVGQPLRGNLEMQLNDFPLQNFMPAGVKKKVELPLFGTSAVTFEGSSTQEWAQNLNGTLDMTSKNGRMVGLSLKDLAGGLKGFLSGQAAGDGRDFQLLQLSYEVEKGVARSKKVLLDAGDLTVTGDGKIDLANWTINHRLVPVAKGLNVGQITNLSIPVVIKGPLTDPSVRPDMTSPQGLGAGIGAAVGGPVGAAAGAILGGFLSGAGEKPSSTPETDGTASDSAGQEPVLDLQADPELLKKNIKSFFKNGTFGQ